MSGKLRSRIHRPSPGALVAACALVAATAGMAVAAVPDSVTGAITACYRPSTGAMRIIDAQAGKKCASGEAALTWNKQGERGPKGDPCLSSDPLCVGPKGDRGATGETGATGTTGATGADGPTGPQGPAGAKGDTGDKGDRGDAGDAGGAGGAGDVGPTGPTGADGPTGPQGPAGTVPGLGTDTGTAAAGGGLDCAIGEVILTAGVVAVGIPARGQLLAISEYQSLFSLLGTRYDETVDSMHFRLPDLRAVAPDHMTYSICVVGIYPSRT